MRPSQKQYIKCLKMLERIVSCTDMAIVVIIHLGHINLTVSFSSLPAFCSLLFPSYYSKMHGCMLNPYLLVCIFLAIGASFHKLTTEIEVK